MKLIKILILSLCMTFVMSHVISIELYAKEMTEAEEDSGLCDDVCQELREKAMKRYEEYDKLQAESIRQWEANKKQQEVQRKLQEEAERQAAESKRQFEENKKAQEEAKRQLKEGGKMLDERKRLMKNEKALQKRYEKILTTFENQQKQYQKYLDSLK